MIYLIRIEKEAAKTLAKIVKSERRRIVVAIEKLKHNSDLGSQLSGKWKGLRRLRVGDYRIIYGIKSKQLLILVVKIGHRREIYQ
ncbi:MAG: type II toxin-antitoxin system RelE/ParE family toxin [Candidatus Omnitrophica bacterium]|nr:type II toxin-antitoxin system RelE/ParE family toxin [Candidatus Omnitrophota bacterium]